MWSGREASAAACPDGASSDGGRGPGRLFKADPPLVVNAGAALALAVAFQVFKAIAG
jgi:hypothetical protein